MCSVEEVGAKSQMEGTELVGSREEGGNGGDGGEKDRGEVGGGGEIGEAEGEWFDVFSVG